MTNKLILLIIYISILIGCVSNPQIIETIPTLDPRYDKLVFNQKDGIDSYGNIFGNCSMTFNNKVEKIDFSIYRNEAEGVLISIPSNWQVKSEDFLFLAEIDSVGDEFFLILKHKEENINRPMDEYLRQVYQELIKDTTTLLVNFQANEITYQNLTSYLIEAEMKDDVTSYYFSSYYILKNENLFEISIKYRKSEERLIENVLFDFICSSIIVDHESLFNTSKSIKKEIKTGYDSGN